MKIGFIGLGNVGSKLSGSLIRNGHNVTVLDLNPGLMAQKSPYGRKDSKQRGQLQKLNSTAIKSGEKQGLFYADMAS